MLLGFSFLVVGCASSPMGQEEYKSRLIYCEDIDMTVLIEKNEKNRPVGVECIDTHGSTFDSMYKNK